MPERDEWLTSLKRSWRKGPGQSPCVTVTTVQGDTVASLCERVECCHHLFIEANSSLKCYYGTLKPETDLQAGKPVALPAEGTKCTNTRGRRQCKFKCKLCHPGEYPRGKLMSARPARSLTGLPGPGGAGQEQKAGRGPMFAPIAITAVRDDR